MKYAIEDGVPVPAPKKGGGCPSGPRTELTRVLWSLMPSQSFLVETAEEYRKVLRLLQRLPDRRFATRKVERTGWRVWRVA
jgi:hypothetical protein